MREISLDITPFEEKISLHSYLKEQMDFPFYYGANLDALYDMLTSVTDPVNITLTYPAASKGKMKDYLPRLLQVFQDAVRENYHLTVQYRQVEA